MQFKQAYNRADFLHFLETDFLPEDFLIEEETINFESNYTRNVIRLGECKSLELDVFEVQHTSTHDARVGLSKEAFRLLYNRSTKNKALVLFVPIDNPETYRFSLVSIEVELDEHKIRKSFSNPRRYSYLLGEGAKVYTPTKYLSLKGRVKDAKDLQDRFSVEVLTKEFYNELSDWYAWAIEHVQFPSQPVGKSEDEIVEHKSKNVIRLLTRLLFVWFLKQKHLIPDQFFDEAYLNENLLIDFAPNQQVGLFAQKNLDSKYYKAILQNLFFAMLNCPITPQSKEDNRERGFRKNDNWGQHRDANFLMRYENLFKDSQLFLSLANEKVPFLNGGLFDCLDNKSAEPPVYIDGFSDNLPSVHKLVVPDYLFFGEELGKAQDLSKFYGDKKKKQVNAKGLIDILKTYNFTIEENTPYDQEVSLDPELLGKVFENLLASYNPETKTTARKQTGSFYTPREIVQYMVDESLVLYLKKEVGEELEPEYRKLMSFNENDLNLSVDQRKSIIKALFGCKIIDPACGSGAFPVGVLQQMVHILRKIDERNETWKEILIDDAITETNQAYREATNEERADMVAEIERNFNNDLNRPDYARKLYLIENCIYGVDIQPIAVQISKLRFFISLVVEQDATIDAIDNFNIRPLPNLEAKFVAANTLWGLKKGYSITDTDEIRSEKVKLQKIRHKIFSARNSKTKAILIEKDNEIRNHIALMLSNIGIMDSNDAQKLAGWNPYDQNTSSPFFDPEWMFGLKEGFDIVIGNPPYVRPHKLSSEIKVELWKHFSTFEKKADLYVCFIEKGVKILNDSGILTLIVSNGCLRLDSFENLRKFILKETSINLIVDFENDVFESATVKTCILSIKRSKYLNTRIQTAICTNSSQVNDLKYKTIAQSKFDTTYKSIFDLSSDIILNKIKDKLHKGSESLGGSFKICFGLKTGDDEKFLSRNRLNDTYKKLLRGENIDKYRIKFQGEYVFFDTDEMKRHKKTSRPGTSERYEQPKILIRDTGGGLRGTFDNDCYYVKDVLIVEHPSKSTTLLKKLIGLLNSKLMSFYYDTSFPTLHVQRDELASLPIKSTLFTNATYNIVPDIVDQILLAKKSDTKADTNELEKEIDRLVYELYDLTEEEIKIVEGT